MGYIVPGSANAVNEGFYKIGHIEFEHVREDGDYFLSIFFSSGETEAKDGIKYRRFDVGLENNIELPQKIKQGKVAFFGNQLIVQGSDGDFLVNFYVQNPRTPENLTPEIETIGAQFLRVIKGNSPDNLRSSECDCKCVPCNDRTGCPSTLSCSCGCPSGDQCSVTCYSDHEATCLKNCGGNQ